MSTIVTYADEQCFNDHGHWARPMLGGTCFDYFTDTGRVIRKFSVKDGSRCSHDLKAYASKPQNCPERSYISYEGASDKRPYYTTTRAEFMFNLQPGPLLTAPWIVFAQYNCAPLDLTKPWKSPPVAFGAVGEEFLFTARWDIGVKEVRIPLQRRQIHVGMYFIDGRGGAGSFEVTFDGVPVMDYAGPLGYADHGKCYFAHGIYRSPYHAQGEDMLVHFENLSEGVA